MRPRTQAPTKGSASLGVGKCADGFARRLGIFHGLGRAHNPASRSDSGCRESGAWVTPLKARSLRMVSICAALRACSAPAHESPPSSPCLRAVARYRLSENFFGRRQVEHVVDDLERHAEVRGRTYRGFLPAPGSPRQEFRPAACRPRTGTPSCDRSGQNARLNEMSFPSFSIWSSSPSTICWVSSISVSRTRKLRSCTAILNACM